ncbi:hypothetical protein [Leptothoe spongobia]|uniref:Uncharacterized protein n=1 Tax=Leptothoe spongobia TAU-MAC 1115 TaxID=1967444 RepID=A0A947GJQ6_9CYAN|nr:hypothetical protein [Leptothoe spongobia]MBT9317170.1 hypothetical protein [Leptothoe spongobia TAU-MAC 1115]
MQRIALLSSLILATSISTAMPTMAQVTASEKQNSANESACIATTPAEQIALNAAKNEARQIAELTNGGLSAYRAEAAMHGAAIASPCEMLGPAMWQFTIRGGEPTAVALEEEYTILSVVTVEGTGRDRNVTLNYNGPIEEYVQ